MYVKGDSVDIGNFIDEISNRTPKCDYEFYDERECFVSFHFRSSLLSLNLPYFASKHNVNFELYSEKPLFEHIVYQNNQTTFEKYEPEYVNLKECEEKDVHSVYIKYGVIVTKKDLKEGKLVRIPENYCFCDPEYNEVER